MHFIWCCVYNYTHDIKYNAVYIVLGMYCTVNIRKQCSVCTVHIYITQYIQCNAYYAVQCKYTLQYNAAYVALCISQYSAM